MAQSAIKIKGLSWLLSPWTILGSVILGVLVGLYAKPLVPLLAPLGTIFLTLLKVCVIPLIVTIVTASFARLLHSGDAKQYLKRILVIFSIGMLLAAILGLVIALIADVGSNLSDSAQQLLGHLVTTGTAGVTDDPSAHLFGTFLKNLLPDNIVLAASEANNAGVLIFSILLGVSLGFVSNQAGRATLDVFDGLAQSLLKLVNGVIYLLPLGMLSLFAEQASLQGGLAIFGALGKLIITIYLSCLALMLFYNFVMAKILQRSFWQVILALKEALIIAFLTTSSFATLPFLIRDLEDQLGLDRNKVNFILPMGICLNEQGSVLTNALLVVFLLHLYHLPLTLGAAVILIIGCILTSVADSGTPAIATFSLLSIVLSPLGLPVSTALLLFVPIAQIIDPIITVTNIYGNCMATSLIIGKSSRATH